MRPPFLENREPSIPGPIRARQDTIAAARANGETIVFSSKQSGDRVLMLIEAPAGADEAESLALASAGLQAKAAVLEAAKAQVVDAPVGEVTP